MNGGHDERNQLSIGIDCLLAGERPSGVERATLGLLEGLAEIEPPDQHFAVLIAEGRDDAVPPGPALRALTAPRWAGRRAGRVLYEQLIAAARLRAESVDVVHGPAYVLPLNWDGPSVVTIHDAITVCRPEWCQWHNVVHYGMVMTASARRASAVVAPSEFTKQELIEHLGVESSRVRVAPLGVSESFAPADEEAVERLRGRYDLPEKYLLSVGNLEPRKNLAGVVRAFEALAGAIPHHLVIAGKCGWKYKQTLAAIEGSPVADRIRRLDWIAEEDLCGLYSGAEVLVQWSLHEGFGLTPLEAMACGTPVVISDGGALPEVAGKAAMVVPLDAGPEGLAGALRELVDDAQARARMSRRGIEHSAKYRWAAHAEVVARAYREVAIEAQ